MAKNLLFGLMGIMKNMDENQKKSKDLNENWTLFIVNVLEKSIERREYPHLAKFWKLDCLQTEIKAIFDPTNNCTLGTVSSEGFLYKVAPLELKISPLRYFVIHNSVVLVSKILKIIVPF